MRIIPVLDLKGGRAVHAVAGDRASYRPLRSVFAADADPLAIARGLAADFGAAEVYVADLDAIAGRAAPAWDVLARLADLGLVVWADAGVADAGDVGRLLDAGVGRVVAGLETLAGPSALGRIVAAAGGARVAFSLDLRDGVPIVPPGADWGAARPDPAAIARQAVDAGVGAIIRLDLATVGTGRGVADVPPAPAGPPGVEQVAGGGVRSAADLATLAGLGYAATLVGSAVHDGRIGPAG